MARGVVALVMTTGMLGGSPAMGEVPTGPSPTPTVDLADPSAGVTDPLADYDPLMRNCSPGQVDVNTAEAEVIASALHVPSDKAIANMLASREWLRPIDVISVPGVGVSKKRVLAHGFCATATTLPPEPANAPPAGFDGVDLQVATADEIASLGVLPATTSRRLADYGPLPDDLHQIAAPAVPGLSDPLIDKLMARDDVAISPFPFAQDGTTWRWASEADGTIVTDVDDPRYALFVPGGAVSGDGAWATVTILPDVEGELPRVDPTIQGAFTGEVAVQLPSALGTAAESMVVHDASDGARLSRGAGIADGPEGTLIVAASSLSHFTSTTGGETLCSPYSRGSLYCEAPARQAGTWDSRDTPINDLLFRQYRYNARYSWNPQIPPSGGPCPDTGNTSVSVSGSMHSMRCDGSAVNGSSASFSWNNKSGSLLAYGNPYAWRATNASPSVSRAPKGIFVRTTLDEKADREGVLMPGDSLTVSVAQGAGGAESRVQTTVNPEEYWAISELLEPLAAAAIGAAAPSAGQAADYAICISHLGAIDARTVWGCAETVFTDVANLHIASNPGTARSIGLATAKTVASRVSGYLILGNALFSSISWLSDVQWDAAAYEYRNPPPPPPDAPGTEGKYIARVGVATYLISPPGTDPTVSDESTATAREIDTAGDFNCYATGYLVMDRLETYVSGDGKRRIDVGDQPVILYDGKAPPCTSLSLTWDYVSVHKGGNVPDGVLIKQPDWIINWAGYVGDSGQLQWDSNGAAYVCLTDAGTPVIFNFPEDKVNDWLSDPRYVGPTLSTCPL